MSFKTTIVIAVLLALLGGYAYWFEYKGGKKKEEQKEKEKTLFETKKEDATQIQIEGIAEGQPVLLVPDGKDAWKLTQPVKTKADQGTVDRILSAFEKLQRKEIIEEQPKDLSAYELDKPKMTIRLTLKGNVQRTVAIGAKNPIDNVYYIRVDKDPRVYLSEGTVGDLSSITLFDLRDKKLTDFTVEKVESIAVKTADLDLQFKKENEVWKMIQPVQSPASDSEISSLLSALESLRATRFVDQPAADLSEYGLKEPFAAVELALEKGLRQKQFFGKAEGETYVRIEGNPTVAAVGDTLNSVFEKKIEDWREKKLFVFNRFDAEEFRARIGGKEYSFKKTETDKWSQLAPAKGEVEYDQIQTALEKLESAEITKYGDVPDLAGAPVAEIFVTLKDWQDKTTRKHLVFGPVSEDIQAVKNNDYGTIVYAPASLLRVY